CVRSSGYGYYYAMDYW
nr:immunoglobulin heavy chain junction region [Mus musculus]